MANLAAKIQNTISTKKSVKVYHEPHPGAVTQYSPKHISNGPVCETASQMDSKSPTVTVTISLHCNL